MKTEVEKKETLDLEDKKINKGKKGKGKKKPFERKPNVKGRNDPTFYSYNPELVRSAGNLSFGEVTGTLVKSIYGGAITPSTLGHSIADLAVINLAHTIDTGLVPASDLTDPTHFGVDTAPATVAARNIYSFVRHANSGHTNYEAPDLFMYLLAMGDAYSLYFYLVRIYALLNTYDPRNRTYPRKVFYAMGLDFNDFIGHIADLRYFILSIGARLAALNTPKALNYFARASMRYAGLYKDCEDGKSSTIMFIPQYFFKWSPVTSGSGLGSRLLAEEWYVVGDDITFNQLITDVQAILDPLFSDEDIGIMSGDILKAYGEGNVHRLGTIDENISVFPIFDRDILGQIENATPINGADTTQIIEDTLHTWDVYQTADGVICQQRRQNVSSALVFTEHYSMQSRIFNEHVEAPEPIDILEHSALICTFGTDEDGRYALIDHCGAEVVTHVEVYKIGLYPNVSADGSTQSVIDGTSITLPAFVGMGIESLKNSQLTRQNITVRRKQDIELAMARSIDFLPLTYVYAFTGTYDATGVFTVSEAAIAGYLGDMDNYTTYTVVEARKWHDARWMSLLNIPAIK